MEPLQGARGTTPPCPEAKFAVQDVVKVKRRKHLAHLPSIGAIVAVVPPGFSPDWALADAAGEPRPLMCLAGEKKVTYIVAFENDLAPHLMREEDLLSTGQKSLPVEFVGDTEVVG